MRVKVVALANKGCTNQSIRLVYNFLRGRQMHIREGVRLSNLREVNGGSPQGTKLGNFLFCVTLETLDTQSEPTADLDSLSLFNLDATPVQPNIHEMNDSISTIDEAVPQEYRRGEISLNLTSEINENIKSRYSGLRNKKNVLRDTVFEDSVKLHGRDLNNWSLMYIDDLNIGEVHAMEKAKSLFSQLKEKRTVHATHCEERLETIEQNASGIGMRINTQKTQLLCVSDTRFCDTQSYINTKEGRVNSVKQMKILGFIFEDRPSVGAHIQYSIDKFNRALWALIHLKRAKMTNGVLLEVYRSMLLPLLEYCSPVFHHMLTVEQDINLERQQKRALKIIYGFGKEYEELLSLSGLSSLKERKIKGCADFTIKMSNSDRFSDLFPINNVHVEAAETRNRRIYYESFARTNRLYNSPLYSMRRYLNEH